jgi:hypothetical protein
MTLNFFVDNHKDYKVQFSKGEAVKELKKDPRVAKITTTPLSMTIITIPIIPKCQENIHNRVVGTYKIEIGYKLRKISHKVTRIQGRLQHFSNRDQHTHIMSDGHICWGNVEDEIKIISNKKDWYWLVKRCLDLIYNFDEGTEYNHCVERQITELANDYDDKMGVKRKYDTYN